MILGHLTYTVSFVCSNNYIYAHSSKGIIIDLMTKEEIYSLDHQCREAGNELLSSILRVERPI